ncbi:tripartite tricarboxylate transporter TctB family protein [Microlunatus flavus]|uniref:Putative tricarboxylic transport membrane protein n=1 Tax=Microlunatus flavus TaxID=1036181 RepID=A0A1H9AUP5_9ACTN|nr:tripartite tricarboxylate transporter TctB family protein [Microlunatus flavus]SEP80504.1 putative tricarboxylic transport membrane protein [Microlunatus flavus]
MSTAPSVAQPAAAGPAAGPRRDLAQVGVCAFLLVLGVVVTVQALELTNQTSIDPLGARAVPLVVGIALVVLAVVLLVAVLRGSRPEQEAGEDVDLQQRMDLRTVLLLVGVFAANIALIDLLGWVISGSLLFYGSVIALGSRHFVRDLAVAVVMALVTFYGFAIGLGVGLPAGILQGIL